MTETLQLERSSLFGSVMATSATAVCGRWSPSLLRSRVTNVGELLDPVGWVVLVGTSSKWLRVRVFYHHVPHILSLKMCLQSVDHIGVCAVKLGPHLNTEDAQTLSIELTLVADTHARDHVNAVELVRDNAEDELVPDGLHKGQLRLEIDLHHAALRVHFIFPSWFDVLLEETESVHSRRSTIDRHAAGVKRELVF